MRYGILRRATMRTWGYTMTSAAISVARISTISREASTLFLRINCIGENARLKMILRTKGSATIRGILPVPIK